MPVIEYCTKLSRIAVLIEENVYPFSHTGISWGAFWHSHFGGNIWLLLTDWGEILHGNLIGVLDNLGKGCWIFMIPGQFFWCAT